MGIKMKEQTERFDFCPKCGALTRDGVCQSCGYHLQSDNGQNNTQINNPERNGDRSYADMNTQYYNPGYVPVNQTPKKNDTTVIVAVVIGAVILFLLLFAVTIFSVMLITVKSSQTNETNNYTEVTEENVQNPDNGQNFADDNFFGDEEERGKEEELQPNQEANGTDPFLTDDYENRWGTNHENHNKADFTGEYYDNIVECIDESVDYQVNRKYYEYQSDNGNVLLRVAYYQLEGDIPNIDELNDEIMAYSAYMAGNYFENYSESDYEGTMELSTDSYITFNDDRILSILLNEEYAIDGTGGFDLYGINVDLQNGVILENDKILDVDEAFASTFRERNEAQNEYDGKIPAVDNLTDGEIAEELASADSNIIFYTPMGMEVGFNYANENGVGWVTVTYKDYENYLKSF